MEFMIADVVVSTAGRDAGKLFYVIETDETYLTLANGKDRSLEKPKRKKRKHACKVLRSETRVAEKLRNGDKVLNSELRRDLAYLSREMQSKPLGG
ncbi:MAG: KOW domain-containing RNA-binding protein [Oscillospiraceae bacterium]|nr:KOW domain-containing RNA-binding protein [Oscillospiraceae bacterium]